MITPVPGWVSRSREATRMPSSVRVGGIRMSVSTTSGLSRSMASNSESMSPQVAAMSTVGEESSS